MTGPNILNFASKVVFLNGLPLTLPTATSDPGGASAGDMYYNTTSNTIRYYNGTAWSAVGSGGITQLTGDVTAGPGSGSQASTVAKIQGTTVAGTTGTGDVVFASSPSIAVPTLTGATTLTGELFLTSGLYTVGAPLAAYPGAGGAVESISGTVNGQILTWNTTLGMQWVAPTASANQFLSNLTSPTAINQDLTFATTGGGGGAHNVTVAAAGAGDNGDDLDLSSGASGAGTDLNGGNVNFTAGAGTGAGQNTGFTFNLPIVAGSSGSSAQTPFLAAAISYSDVEASVTYPFFVIESSDQNESTVLITASSSGGGSGINHSSINFSTPFFINANQNDAYSYNSTSNTVGTDLNLRAGASSGNQGANINFYIPQAGTSGGGTNASALAMSISGQNELRLRNPSSPSNYVGLRTTTSTSYTIDLPTSAPSNGQLLQATNSTTTTWTTYNAISQLTGDVTTGTATGSQSEVSTIAAIQGTAVSGTTGSGDVVFSANPTFTGTVTAAALSATTGSFSGAVNMNGEQINNLASPSVSTDAATKGYVDAAISGLTWKGPAQVYAASNVALTGGATLTIDSHSVQNGDLVILGNQTTASQNGEYTVSGIGTTYILTANGQPSAAGDAWLILSGTVYANSAFVATAAVPTATFVEFAGPTSYAFTAPLQLSGNTVSITQANTSTNGYLSSTDWNTFNDKQPAGNYITALTGDGTAVGPGSATFTLATVNGSPGTFAVATVAVNGKGLITSASAASTTGTGNVVMSASPTFTGTIAAAAMTMSSTLTTAAIASTGVLSIDVNSGNSAIQIESSSVQRSTNGTNFVTETYVDSTSLTDNTTAAITAFQFTTTNFAGEEITYVIESGDANADCRVGTIRVTANNSGTITPSLSDMYSESADCGVTWSASNSGGTISVSYTTTLQGAARTMRADVKQFRR